MTAETISNELIAKELAASFAAVDNENVLEAIQKVVDLNSLTSFLLKHGYYLTRTTSCARDWRGAQELHGREGE